MSNETNPWKTLQSEDVYESPWILVKKHAVINPAGNAATYSTIQFKNKAIGILPLDEAYNTWIVGQYRYPTDCYSWEIPEGGGHPDVPYQESAARELLEETGIKAKTYIEIMRMHLSNSASNEEAIVFVARDLSFHEAEPEETEELQVKKIPFDELFNMVNSGQIIDAITIAAVYKTKQMIDSGIL
jgi:8-oxo-dGTP pyrophosphatase MutT (NUDIX family)